MDDLIATVVVCAYEPEPARFTACLAALATQRVTFRYQVLLIDDGSAETLEAVASQHAARFHRLAANTGIGNARRTGVELARGSYVAFCDDDCVPDGHWLEELIGTIRRTGAVGVAGRLLPERTQTVTERYLANMGYGRPAPSQLSENRGAGARFLAYLGEMHRPTTLRDGDSVAEVYTANAAFDRGAVLAVGNFDGRLRSGEDVDLSRRLVAVYPSQGLRYAERATASLANDANLSGLLRKTFRRYEDVLLRTRYQGQVPPIFPSPLAVAAVISVVRTGRDRGLAAIVAPAVAYSWWPLRSGLPIRDKFALPYMQLLVESAALAGLVNGYRKHFLTRDLRRLLGRRR